MSNTCVRIHPVVLFSILDAYERRQPDQNRVIGTLLGTHDKSGNVEISNCFVVQHREANKEVAIDIEVAKDLYELHRRVNANEVIVGWFATGGGEVNEYSVLIHDYYSRETSNPIHVTVDPVKDGISLKAYVSTPFGVPNKITGTMFSPIKSVQTAAGYDTEMVGLKACMASSGINDGKKMTFDTELDMILSSTKKSQDIIATLIKFIDESILLSSGKPIPSNTNEIGRQLMTIIESVVPFDDNEETLNTNLKDLLMVIYLSNLCKTQLMLNEKLTLLI
ncbi:eukaryotic translation initiation factor 3 subunit F-like protein [Dinothrombium tinctorium]|uniref:Eukaryotic translation initiation factor 3 subunit F-like protein n=1 Tax=Dinothrombium tinctorium TaxID=1965070 RepID=A0A443QQ40_9ACAR|nr:eukaryotic translation initiation factor 3 subunit F-like protein [Dinothrombium tinctorium]